MKTKDKTLEEIYSYLDETSFVPLSATWILTSLVNDLGSYDLKKVIDDIAKRLEDGRWMWGDAP